MLLELNLFRKLLPLLATLPRALFLAFERLQPAKHFAKLAFCVEEILHAHKDTASAWGGTPTKGTRGVVDVTINSHRLHANLAREGNLLCGLSIIADKGLAENEVHGVRDFLGVANERDCQANFVTGQ